ncbi:ABC transporter ATP-binding protein [Streptomyces malaysiensis subsp. malaysiensis]|uniref:Nitrate/sulfonate/bicarbonate ABC transporter ATP-binding protein n=1 Tax=Streptomyces autolyticus TaxID=75293 RepID=A0ABN4VW91_9ACTN|nr:MULTISPECIES: ABC transporter ATP-binding protein [Streptomyces]AQA09402.1 nitrate/sulfonate/bicarbonate ABC transporter ATP-binding protein [Streptomyces autolyticus]WHX23697.1 ABC transporter ATP-binding protein [Streptomyces sp. NA07423]
MNGAEATQAPAAGAQPYVVLDGVGKVFTSTRTGERETVFEDFTLTVRQGELVAVVGASGTGKTTLLHLVAGLEEPDSGEIRLADGTGRQRIRGRSSGAGSARNRLGVVFQQPRLLDWISVRRNVELALTSAGLDPAGAARALADVGLAEYADRYPSVLSGGQRQRAAVARAFAVEPELILLDEPFSALDQLTARRLRLLLQELWTARPRTGLLVTHNPLEAAFLADRVIVLDGRPARVRAEFTVGLPRPRSPEDPRIFARHNEILAALG